ncbi:MAG: undecaprenyl-diphosphate phosphatase [Candidatus Spechtbacteria bacterium SB0662_bin_43]|uniref:Undecaprenyl-diphosphatase n=1 Tax=Candidatus Spechtbacteria bacterium SB0662_bin_43 TaxID=2604897 RepID=A0A845DBB7_9BACT|nr:undecaprenyl-diphosphate phosphatase [Candidatus Spechtbacteria bacterium SB0662_bin_43]
MLEALIQGTIQGITEWLPVSSEGIIVLVNNSFFGDKFSLKEDINYALFLHIGTFFAALVYFHSDVINIIKGMFRFKKATDEMQSLILFLFFSTVISGIIGFIFLSVIERLDDSNITGPVLMLFVGIALAITGFLQWRYSGKTVAIKKQKPSMNTIKEVVKDMENLVSTRINPTARGTTRQGNRFLKDLTISDAIFLGIMQGLTIIPGLSRSGTTIAFLLMRNIDSATALRLSFLMSLPVVLGVNLYKNYDELLNISTEWFAALLVSFFFGIITIHSLLRLAQRVNFAIFVFMLSGLTIVLSLYSIIF